MGIKTHQVGSSNSCRAKKQDLLQNDPYFDTSKFPGSLDLAQAKILSAYLKSFGYFIAAKSHFSVCLLYVCKSLYVIMPCRYIL